MRLATTLAPLGLALALTAPLTHAAGMTVHAFMADIGRESLKEGRLQNFLNANRATLMAGAMYPDGGYASGDRELAEHAHWGEWSYDFIAYLRDDLGCDASTFAGSTEPAPAAINPSQNRCEKLAAFMMGNAAHGMGDEVWDALFEPQVLARGESSAIPLPLPGNPLSNLVNTIEYAMDMCAIVDHLRAAAHPSGELPLSADLVAIYGKHGLVFSEQQVQAAAAVTRTATQAEIAAANSECPRIRQQMPWAARHYYSESGGVLHVGQMIAGMYEYLWRQLSAPSTESARPRVVGVHPLHGETEVPFAREDSALAIRAYFDGYVAPDALEAQEQFCLFDEQGQKVAGSSGAGIYRRDYTHTMHFSPAEDLKPNSLYTAVVTTGVPDHQGQGLARTFAWTFTTAPAMSLAATALAPEQALRRVSHCTLHRREQGKPAFLPAALGRLQKTTRGTPLTRVPLRAH